MLKTDVEGIYTDNEGVLISKKESSYLSKRAEKIEEERQRSRINKLEKDVSEIKEMLSKILQHVS